ncbi:MAG: hypothetical protein L3K08_03500 [Thermoplasmata archaeon]|nr:hypothetical protein [Thermoplasmata archaeon]
MQPNYGGRGRGAALAGTVLATLLLASASVGATGRAAIGPTLHPIGLTATSASGGSAQVAGGSNPVPNIITHSWTKIATTRAPSPRTEFMMAYDQKDHVVVLFGGTPKVLGDTWTYANGTWTNVSPATSPPARYGGMMTYDQRDGYVLLFGGIGAHGDLNDTWGYSAGVWTNLTGAHAPPPRFLGSMAFDPPVGRTVLFGGCAFLAPGQELCSPKGGFNDTWTFHGGVWTEITGHRVHPHARYGAGLAYDPASKVLVLYGGNGATAFVETTWELVGQKWTLISKVNAPGTRGELGMIYSPAENAVVLFGGTTGEFPSSAYLGGTFLFQSGSWSTATVSGPGARDNALLSYYPHDRAVLEFGGYGGPTNGYYNETWEFS